MRRFLTMLALTPMLAACALPMVATKTPEAPAGTVLFQDDFSSSATGWDRTANDGGVMDYDAGSYRILVKTLQSNVWSTSHRDFDNSRVEVDAGKLGGPDANRIGIICRLDGRSYYFFIIGSDGYYGIGLFSGGKANLLGQTLMQTSTAIRSGAAINHLRFDCSGNTLTAYVNGTQVASAADQSLTHGEVGVLAGTFDQAGVDIVFDNFVVTQP